MSQDYINFMQKDTLNLNKEMPHFQKGDLVEKTGGDYRFRGFVMAVFYKRSGPCRVVVENDDGLLHIFNQQQLKRVINEPGT